MFVAGCDLESGTTTEVAEQTGTNAEESINESDAPTVSDNEEEDVKEQADDKKENEATDQNTEEDIEEAPEQTISTNDLEGLKVHFIDVGQADASLIEFTQDGESFNILIDSGDWNSNAVVNYLSHRKIEHLDIIVGTHPHADHIGQIDQIIAQFGVEEVWLSGDTATSQVFERVIDAIDQNDIGYHEPRAGEIYDIGPLVMEVVHPQSVNGNLNNGSISLRLVYGEVAFLLTGDSEEEAERGMLNRGANLEADILKLGHHGSNTSTIPAFLDAVNPKVGIISVGKNNQYGHPHDEVVTRVKDKDIDLYATHINGTIIVETDGKSYKVTTKADGNVTPTSSAGQKQKQSTENQVTEQPKKTEEPKKENPSGCIDINSASLEDIQQIIHIGPVRAPDLVELRPFKSVDDLTRIKGIGPSRIKDIISQGIACVGG